MVSQLYVLTLSAEYMQPREEGLSCKLVYDFFPFFDIYELLLKKYCSVHIFCITVTITAYIYVMQDGL